jgi:hypothetical protein
MHSHQIPEGLVRLQAIADNALGGFECAAVEETVVVQEENLGGMVIVLAALVSKAIGPPQVLGSTSMSQLLNLYK